jgi:hypothetical protein
MERTSHNPAKTLTRQELAKAEARAVSIPTPAANNRPRAISVDSIDSRMSSPPKTSSELASRAIQPARRRPPPPQSHRPHPNPLQMHPPSISAEEQHGLRIAAIRLKLNAAQKLVLSILDASDAMDSNVLAQVADAAVSLRTAAAYIRPAKITPLCPDEVDGLIFQFALEDECPPILEASSR